MPDFTELKRIARQETGAVIEGLPAALREAALKVPLVLERVPTDNQIADGLEPDLLGLFVGPEYSDQEAHGSLPPQILLFLENLWDFAEEAEDTFREEVRTTYLHELGHYLGLDEDDLDERGLA
ncbi:MAG TPA: hypothetical protein DCY13_08900 [Verrucomicrobiales bacterium]|nr:hypothetical protein [Verrucomicrobiales bacterium]